MMYKLTWEPY